MKIRGLEFTQAKNGKNILGSPLSLRRVETRDTCPHRHCSGFLVDWGLRSPLYPAAAAAAAEASAESLKVSGILQPGVRVEWVWHDSACDATRVSKRRRKDNVLTVIWC